VAPIIDVGDALISFGDFLENNKILLPSPYVQEWWEQDLEKAIARPWKTRWLWKGSPEEIPEALSKQGSRLPTVEEAFLISERLDDTSASAYYTPHFDNLSLSDLIELRSNMRRQDSEVVVQIGSHEYRKISLRALLVPYLRLENEATLSGEDAWWSPGSLNRERATRNQLRGTLEMIRHVSPGSSVSRQTTATVGMRVGRPEKAMLRHMKPPVHVLFPVGSSRGKHQRPDRGIEERGDPGRRSEHNVPVLWSKEALQQVPGVQRSDDPIPELPKVRPGPECRRRAVRTARSTA
jgi:DNA polymerase II large subunit